MFAIEVNNLKKSFISNFGSRMEVLKGVSFQIKQGEITGYLGPNGAGKTTTFKILTGLIEASSGSVLINGVNGQKTESRRRLGYLPEGPYFYDHLTAVESLYFYGSLFGLKKNELGNRVDALLDQFGLNKSKNRKLMTYSKGMRQRLGFAQCLINDPDVIILDEPMSGLDPMGRKEFRDAILDLKERGKTILLSSHIMNDVETICSRVILMSGGIIREEGVIREILKKTSSGVEIEFQNISDQYKKYLNENEYTKIKDGAYVILHLESGVDLNSFLEKLIENGDKIEKVTPHNQSLEEYFFKLADEK